MKELKCIKIDTTKYMCKRKIDLFLMREKVTYTRSTVWCVTHEAPPASEGRRRKWIALLAKILQSLGKRFGG